MRSREIISHINRAGDDPADTTSEAIDRVRLRILKGLIREHLGRSEWHEKMATELEQDMDTIIQRNGWEESLDLEDDAE